VGFDIAFAVCVIGTAGLFYLDRDKSVRASKALWLPVMWLWLVGSRPVSEWLAIWFGWGGLGAGSGLDAQVDGSPLDAIVFMALTAAAIAVLLQRSRATVNLLRSSLPVLIYFLYCAASCLWSPIPDVAFKRWIKDVGDLAMVLVIVTDPEPINALRRVFSRVGFVLLPSSILLIRYSALGRAYDPSGGQVFTGVTDNKNTLGLITFIISLGAMWSFFNLLRAKRRHARVRTRQLVARGVLVAFGLGVLYEARSDTSTSSFMLGALLILATSLSFFRRRPKRVHMLVLSILLLGGIGFLLGGTATVAGAYGKNSNLSDRTTIWAAAIPVCPNPIVGAGFESFWNGYGKYVTGGLSKYERGLNSAHNGYIEIYLNLGWVGVSLIAMLLFVGYRRAWTAFRINPEVGGLMLAYVAAVAIYNITEAGFRILTPTWIFFLLVLVGSRSSAVSVSGSTAKPIAAPVRAGLRRKSVHEVPAVS
jgi:exopolysaccharide production protein ExoQ